MLLFLVFWLKGKNVVKNINVVGDGRDIRLKASKSMNHSVEGHQLYKHITVTVTLVRNIVLLRYVTNILGLICSNSLLRVIKIMIMSLSLIKFKAFHTFLLYNNIIILLQFIGHSITRYIDGNGRNVKRVTLSKSYLCSSSMINC